MDAQIFLFCCLTSEYWPLIAANTLLLVNQGNSCMLLLFLLESK